MEAEADESSLTAAAYNRADDPNSAQCEGGHCPGLRDRTRQNGGVGGELIGG